jgi:predicted nucleic acid-binding protein
MGQELNMPDLILIDTDILVDFFRGHSLAVNFISINSPQIILSSIVVAELYAGIKTNAERTALDNFISIFRIIPVTSEIAKSGGLYKYKYGKSHGIGLADAIIAATAQAENADLKTLNIRHYPMFKNLKPAYKK